jgi:riboflavin synthase
LLFTTRHNSFLMFTGLVETLAKIVAVEGRPPGRRLIVEAGELARDVALGDSISVSGCCLTVVVREGLQLGFDAGPETLERTNLAALEAGSHVNLERSLCVGDRLGGHFVTGHIDGLGSLAERHDEGDWSTFWFGVSPALARQMASKGSVAVDGVSLTLVDVESEQFSVALIPHTLAVTTLGKLRVGDHVNIETDVLAKYVEKQLGVRSAECGMIDSSWASCNELRIPHSKFRT